MLKSIRIDSTELWELQHQDACIRWRFNDHWIKVAQRWEIFAVVFRPIHWTKTTTDKRRRSRHWRRRRRRRHCRYRLCVLCEYFHIGTPAKRYNFLWFYNQKIYIFPLAHACSLLYISPSTFLSTSNETNHSSSRHLLRTGNALEHRFTDGTKHTKIMQQRWWSHILEHMLCVLLLVAGCWFMRSFFLIQQHRVSCCLGWFGLSIVIESACQRQNQIICVRKPIRFVWYVRRRVSVCTGFACMLHVATHVWI